MHTRTKITPLLIVVMLFALLISGCQPIEGEAPDQNNEGNAPTTLEATVPQSDDNAPTEDIDEASTSCAEGGQTITDYLQSDTRFGQFVNLMESGGLMGMLDQDREGGFTVFAFTDEAYDALPEEARTLIDADAAELQKYIQYHIVRGTLTAEDLADGTELSTLGGAPLTVQSGTDLSLNESAAILESHPVCNGMVYVLNEVLVTPIPEE